MPGLPTFASSCLIAMALKNSKTGSLPVSEIYSFMKEHFPYFKVRRRSQGWGARAALTSPGTVRPRNGPRLHRAARLGSQLCLRPGSEDACTRALPQTWAEQSRQRRGYLSWALTDEEELTRHPGGKGQRGQPSYSAQAPYKTE